MDREKLKDALKSVYVYAHNIPSLQNMLVATYDQIIKESVTLCHQMNSMQDMFEYWGAGDPGEYKEMWPLDINTSSDIEHAVVQMGKGEELAEMMFQLVVTTKHHGKNMIDGYIENNKELAADDNELLHDYSNGEFKIFTLEEKNGTNYLLSDGEERIQITNGPEIKDNIYEGCLLGLRLFDFDGKLQVNSEIIVIPYAAKHAEEIINLQIDEFEGSTYEMEVPDYESEVSFIRQKWMLKFWLITQFINFKRRIIRRKNADDLLSNSGGNIASIFKGLDDSCCDQPIKTLVYKYTSDYKAEIIERVENEFPKISDNNYFIYLENAPSGVLTIKESVVEISIHREELERQIKQYINNVMSKIINTERPIVKYSAKPGWITRGKPSDEIF